MSIIHLTDELRQALEARGEAPVSVVDPQTNKAYVLLRADVYERVRGLLEQRQPEGESPQQREIPPGIKRSQEALRRDLPKLLENPKLFHQWVAYTGDERIGVARTEQELIKKCIRRGLSDDAYYVGWIDPTELIEEEEVEHGLYEFDEREGDDASPTA